ncbi:MAG: hypothetical protein UU92_C0017G0006 [candidate division WWE3 bacterium GW2011_GWA1_42_12]|nr:MAG: hypothetical protein UU92_C0017G0006 [candidate division WWE3 bacterium GW2011_GWA1_42_12]
MLGQKNRNLFWFLLAVIGLAVFIWAVVGQITVTRVNASLTDTQADYVALKAELEDVKTKASSEKIASANEKVTLEALVTDLQAAQAADKSKLAALEAQVKELTAVKEANEKKMAELATPPEWVWDNTFQGLEPFYKNIDRDVTGFSDPAAVEMTYKCTTDHGIYFTGDASKILGVATVLGPDPVGAVAYIPCKIGQVITFSTTFWSEKSKNIPGHWSVHLNELTDPLPADISVKDALLAHMDGEKKAIALLFDVNGEYELLTR